MLLWWCSIRWRAPNVRAASRTRKNDQKWDFWSTYHGAQRARECARAKKISDSKTLIKIDAFWLLDRCHISKTRKNSKCWSLATNRKFKFSDFKIWIKICGLNFKQNLVFEENFKLVYLLEFRRYEHVVYS